MFRPRLKLWLGEPSSGLPQDPRGKIRAVALSSHEYIRAWSTSLKYEKSRHFYRAWISRGNIVNKSCRMLLYFFLLSDKLDMLMMLFWSQIFECFALGCCTIAKNIKTVTKQSVETFAKIYDLFLELNFFVLAKDKSKSASKTWKREKTDFSLTSNYFWFDFLLNKSTLEKLQHVYWIEVFYLLVS